MLTISLYFRNELSLMLERAGFADVEVQGDHNDLRRHERGRVRRLRRPERPSLGAEPLGTRGEAEAPAARIELGAGTPSGSVSIGSVWPTSTFASTGRPAASVRAATTSHSDLASSSV